MKCGDDEMPLEAYYKHGGLNIRQASSHREVLRFFLEHGTVVKEPFALADHIAIRRLPLPKEVGLGLHAAFFELMRLGFVEPAGFNLANKEMYRIPPHLLEAVERFVSKK